MELTTDNTAIVVDSTADAPEVAARFPNMRVVPLYVQFGEESLRDQVDIGPEDFYLRLAASPRPPTTAQPSPGDFLGVYEELAGRYDRILSLQLSATISGTYASAVTAAEELGGSRVRVVDTRSVSAAIGLLALAIQRRLARGTDDDEIGALVERYEHESHLLFTVDTLDYLAKGGRIGRAAGLAGNLLDVKPVMTFRDGEVVPLKRVRGTRKAIAEFRNELEASSRDVPALRVAIAHAVAPEKAAALQAIVEEVRPHATLELVTSLGAVIGTHAGPGTVGLFWFEDPDG
jgi:DegV family protein with EDD domain